MISLDLESREGQPIQLSDGTSAGIEKTLLPFTTKSDNSPVVTVLISLLLNLCRKRDSTHNPISELLVENRLVGIAIVLHDLIQSVDKGLLGRHLDRATAIGEAVELFLQGLLGDVKQIGQLLNVFARRLGLAVEYGSCSYFIATDMLADFLEAQLASCFGFEERCGDSREIGVFCGLRRGQRGCGLTILRAFSHPELRETSWTDVGRLSSIAEE